MTLADWNWEGVYESQARITEDGWVVEAAVPFTTIRFADADAPVMGILMERTIRRKNEVVYFPHIGQEVRNALTQVSRYATLTGLEGLRRGRYMEVKPFAITGRSTTGSLDAAGGATETLNDLGLDVKYSITPNLTLDATLNPDFAQVEADNVQINLTRFSLFFPEKREFFLERAGLFGFGDAQETEVFFSRRIGIANDIVGGGRLTGQAGPVSVGALSLYTDDATAPGGGIVPGGLNTVLRLRADPFPRTTVGGIFTSLDTDAGASRVVGGDMQIRFGGSSFVQGWVARTSASSGAVATATSIEADLRNSADPGPRAGCRRLRLRPCGVPLHHQRQPPLLGARGVLRGRVLGRHPNRAGGRPDVERPAPTSRSVATTPGTTSAFPSRTGTSPPVSSASPSWARSAARSSPTPWSSTTTCPTWCRPTSGSTGSTPRAATFSWSSTQAI